MYAPKVYRCTHAELCKLWETTGESVHLWILDSEGPLIIEAFETRSRMIRMAPPVGFRNLELHSGAPGKVFLAFGPDELREAWFKKPLRKLTVKTITSAAALKRELAVIRTAGYALDREEGWDGVLCVAAPVYAHDQRLAGVVCMTVARTYYTVEQMEKAFAQILLRSARKISEAMGYAKAGAKT